MIDAGSALAASEQPSVGHARVWALLGNRLGDNRTIEALATASGLAWRALPLRFNPAGALPNLRPRGSLFTLTAASRAQLAEPFPDVAITSGKRAVPVALWLKAASGGRTRLVHLGRPQAPLAWFDLVVTTPQYGLPARPNVLVQRLPFTTAAPQAGAPIRDDLEDLPRPRLAVLVGGSAAPLALDGAAARALAEDALGRARAAGGSLMVATSPRTSDAAVAVLRAALAGADRPVRLSVYGEGPNAYAAFLAAADAFLVTDDSASMVAEAALTGRPVALHRLPERPTLALRAFMALRRVLIRKPATQAAFDTLVGLGLVRSNRDLGLFMHGLEADGLLQGGSAARDHAAAELAEAVARVRALASVK